MNSRGRCTRRALAAWLSALMLALGVAVPVLERADIDHQARWESDHAPGACAPAHDHTVCTQVGANLSLSSDAPLHEPVLGFLRDTSVGRLGFAFRRGPDGGRSSRAPPSRPTIT